MIGSVEAFPVAMKRSPAWATHMGGRRRVARRAVGGLLQTTDIRVLSGPRLCHRGAAAGGEKKPKMSVVEQKSKVPGVEIRGAWGPRYEEILSDEALAFLAGLHRKFNPSRLRLLSLPRRAPGAPRCRRAAGFPARDRRMSATATGRSRRSPPTCSTAASRSPGRPTAR